MHIFMNIFAQTGFIFNAKGALTISPMLGMGNGSDPTDGKDETQGGSDRALISVAYIAFDSFISNEDMTTRLHSRLSSRFDPSDFTADDLESVHHMIELFRRETQPPALVDEHGNRLELPRPIYELLVRVASALQEGKVISLVPETQELTTQAAANILGVSRPHLIKLLESGKLAFHKVGAHRRIRMNDLSEFQQARDRDRRRALDDLARKAQEAGLY